MFRCWEQELTNRVKPALNKPPLRTLFNGRAIDHAVSHRCPPAASLVQSEVMSCGICGGQNSAGAAFLQILRFPLPILIPPIAPYSSITGAGTIMQLLGDVPNGLAWLHPTKLKKKLTTLSSMNEITTVLSNYFPAIAICSSTVLCWTLAAFSDSWSFYTVSRIPWTGDQPVARPQDSTNTE
jgi:hypothetical protein